MIVGMVGHLLLRAGKLRAVEEDYTNGYHDSMFSRRAVTGSRDIGLLS